MWKREGEKKKKGKSVEKGLSTPRSPDIRKLSSIKFRKLVGKKVDIGEEELIKKSPPAKERFSQGKGVKEWEESTTIKEGASPLLRNSLEGREESLIAADTLKNKKKKKVVLGEKKRGVIHPESLGRLGDNSCRVGGLIPSRGKIGGGGGEGNAVSEEAN